MPLAASSARDDRWAAHDGLSVAHLHGDGQAIRLPTSVHGGGFGVQLRRIRCYAPAAVAPSTASAIGPPVSDLRRIRGYRHNPRCCPAASEGRRREAGSVRPGTSDAGCRRTCICTDVADRRAPRRCRPESAPPRTEAQAPDRTLGVLCRLLALLRCAFPEARFLVLLDGGFATPEVFDFLDAEPPCGSAWDASRQARTSTWPWKRPSPPSDTFEP